MKKTICFLLAAFIFVLSGCNSTPNSGSPDKSKPAANTLTDRSLELIGKVDKLAEYVGPTNIYSSNAEITEELKNIADNDYSNPKGIFVIENLDSVVLKTMLSEIEMPEDIAKMLRNRFASVVPSQITARNGDTSLAAASILNYSESFINEDLQSPVTYLYLYENGNNFMIYYNPNDEKIVNASVSIALSDELSKCTSTEEVTDFFERTLYLEGISVTMAEEEK